MKTYSLHFKASGEQISTPIFCEVISGRTSLSYKSIVDEEISNWLKKKKINANSTSILDIVLRNDSNQVIYAQDNWIVPFSIMIKDFDKYSNTDIID